MTGRSRPSPFSSLLLLPGLLAASGTLAAAQDPAGQGEKPKAAPTVTVEAVLVSPQSPGPDTLCRLAVKLKNHTDRMVSSFGFRVRVNGHDLPVYGNQRYLESMEPGETREIALFNFWSSETMRPAAKDGSLTVRVDLVEARWVKHDLEDDVPTWTLLQDVPGLPTSAEASKPFPQGPGGG